MKNDVERLSSANDDKVLFPDLYFFQPKKLFLLKDNTIEIHYLPMVDDEFEDDWNAISNTFIEKPSPKEDTSLHIKLKIHKEAYKEKVRAMLNHIQKGDIYEANFCQEFFAYGTIDPLQTYTQLYAISTPPFATFL